MFPQPQEQEMSTTRHLVIPDMQVKPGVDLSYCTWIGKYIVHKKPEVIVQIGDFADMPSLSSYDKGKKSFEGRRYKLDIEAAYMGMSRMMDPLLQYNRQQINNHKPQYKPRLVLTLGNHEDRISRAVNDDPKLEGTIGLNDLNYESWGWQVVPFLQQITVDGVTYAHYFPTGVMGRPCTKASGILRGYHTSCFAGHQQGRDIVYAKRGDGKSITCIIAGSYYEHEEDYLSKMTNAHWRGVYMLHEVEDGEFDEMAVSIRYLKRKYG
jgi:hypothetical protein